MIRKEKHMSVLMGIQKYKDIICILILNKSEVAECKGIKLLLLVTEVKFISITII